MSRVGKSPIEIPSGVTVGIEENRVVVQGPKGKLVTPLPGGIRAEMDRSTLQATRSNNGKTQRSLHGLTRALLANAVTGVTEGFQRELDVVGIGYKAEMRGKYLTLSVGFSHPIELATPKGIQFSVERMQRTLSNYVATVIVSGIDKGLVGQVAADIRRLRPPDPYKGKGIRYSDETVRTKAGKKGA